MKTKLSLVIITKNASFMLDKTLQSVQGLVDEIIAVDDFSTDSTVEILKKYNAKIFRNHEYDLGKQRSYALKKANHDWILVLDGDEVLSMQLREEIIKVLDAPVKKFNGFWIPFQTHFLGRPLKHGGEDYKKMILFKKKAVAIKPLLVHEKFELKKGVVGYLKYKVYHYSYRSLFQIYVKFHDYAIREAKENFRQGRRSGWKNIVFNPLHMFWSRFIKDKGYKDGIFRIPLDIGFAYMEFVKHFLLVIYAHRSLIKFNDRDIILKDV